MWRFLKIHTQRGSRLTPQLPLLTTVWTHLPWNVPDKETQLEGRHTLVSALPAFLQSSVINCTKQNDQDKIKYHREPSSLCSLSDASVTLASMRQLGCWDIKSVPEIRRLCSNFFPQICNRIAHKTVFIVFPSKAAATYTEYFWAW